MATLAIPSRRLDVGVTVVPLTAVQQALWQLGLPILDASAIAEYKRRAKRGMLWREVRWLLAALGALVALECLGRQWGRGAAVGGAAMLLAALFAWLVTSDLQWLTTGFSTYQRVNTVPPHVLSAANALLACGVPKERLGVEYLKQDPILFVEDTEQGPASRRYDLIIW